MEKEENKKAVKKRKSDNWKFIQNWLISHGCSCGENNIKKLTFHHLNPKEKDLPIRYMTGHSMKRILSELEKGVSKCKNCHTIIHNGSPEEHEEKLVKKYLRIHSHKRLLHKNKLLIWYFKKEQKCEKCGEPNPICLLFHHIDYSTKKLKISHMYKKARDTINQELAKTICLCQNCHEEFHYLYGTRTNQQDLEKYLDKQITPISVDIRDYLPQIPTQISQFYNLSFSLS